MGTAGTARNAGTTRIVVLGGGFAGLYTTRHLESQLRGDRSVHITLVNRVNYFLMPPLLFEAGSGVLEPRHVVNPIRPLLDRARFVQAEVLGLDLDARVVHTRLPDDEDYDVPYDHVVLALGGVVNTAVVPGTEHARRFKTLADAIALRNHVIQTFERADVEPDAGRKEDLLTFVVVGGGLVGVELMGELTSFVAAVCDTYLHVRRQELRFELIEAGRHLVPEFDDDMADYCRRVLEKRGVRVRLNTRVKSIEPGQVNLPAGGGAAGEPGVFPGRAEGETIRAGTIVASTGVLPSPLVAGLPLEKDDRGRVIVEATMRSRGRPEVWALGDNARIPDPQGKPYPPLAQHALREAKLVARNIAAAVRGGELRPFVYANKGTLAALGHYKGVGRVYQFKVYGFVGWWVWRTYYLMQMPQWSRRLRILIDWTIALFFRNDVVQLDLAAIDANPPGRSRGRAARAAGAAAGGGRESAAARGETSGAGDGASREEAALDRGAAGG